MKGSEQIRKAWEWRKERGWLDSGDPLRIFHGPGEGSREFADLAIERFGRNFWVTVWETQGSGGKKEHLISEVVGFFKSLDPQEVESAVLLYRPLHGVPEDAKAVFGTPSEEAFEVSEAGLRYRIRMTGVKHPGLFLDHAPLRQWLMKSSRNWSVLNTFAYTGSLSVAAGAGGAAHVTTLDLSRATIQWAEQNWQANALDSAKARFISGDVFEWLPRLKREGKKFDCVILDPPSFSRGKAGNFSTSKDLKKLHSLAFDVLTPEGVLITSINSANISRSRFSAEVASAARECHRDLQVLFEIGLPETFPTPLSEEARYLKGWGLRSVVGIPAMSAGRGASNSRHSPDMGCSKRKR